MSLSPLLQVGPTRQPSSSSLSLAMHAEAERSTSLLRALPLPRAECGDAELPSPRLFARFLARSRPRHAASARGRVHHGRPVELYHRCILLLHYSEAQAKSAITSAFAFSFAPRRLLDRATCHRHCLYAWLGNVEPSLGELRAPVGAPSARPTTTP